VRDDMKETGRSSFGASVDFGALWTFGIKGKF
jgi:hypothetical protein